MFCSPYALLYRKIPKCPKTFGHDCRSGKSARFRVPRPRRLRETLGSGDELKVWVREWVCPWACLVLSFVNRSFTRELIFQLRGEV